MSSKSQQTKISLKAWEFLRYVKTYHDFKSYSDVIETLHHNLGKPEDIQKTLQRSVTKDFDEAKHKTIIITKIPGETNKRNDISKTILLNETALRILKDIKYRSNKTRYSYSDAIEFLIRQDKPLWESIPKRIKSLSVNSSN